MKSLLRNCQHFVPIQVRSALFVLAYKQGDICRDVVSDGPIEIDYGLAPSVSEKVADRGV